MSPPEESWCEASSFFIHLVFICGLSWFPCHASVLCPESPAHHRGPADLWWPLHVYLWVHPVQPGGLHHGAAGLLPGGDPLDPHAGPHAESRARSVLRGHIQVSRCKFFTFPPLLFDPGLQNPVDALYHLQPLMFIGLFPLFQYNEGECCGVASFFSSGIGPSHIDSVNQWLLSVERTAELLLTSDQILFTSYSGLCRIMWDLFVCCCKPVLGGGLKALWLVNTDVYMMEWDARYVCDTLVFLTFLFFSITVFYTFFISIHFIFLW